MLRRLLAGAVLAALSAGVAKSQSCAAYPYTFQNGSTADAGQVNANFGCATLTGAPIFTSARTYFRGYDGSYNHWFGTSTAAEPTGLWMDVTVTPSTGAVASVAIAPNGTAGLEVLSNGYVGITNNAPTDFLDVAAPVVFGNLGGERLSMGDGSLGFNRKVATGAIYYSGAFAYQWQHTHSTTAASDYLALQVYTPSGTSVTGAAIAVNGLGDVGIGTTAPPLFFFVNGAAGGPQGFTTTSDARLKTNVREITGALDMVERLRGVRFDWRAPEAREVGKDLKLPVGEPQIGFIAQEVETVAPEAVSKPKADADGVYGVKVDNLVPILVEAVKEQQAEIKELRAEVAALRDKR